MSHVRCARKKNVYRTKTRRSPNVVLMLGQRLRRWPNMKPTFGKCLTPANVGCRVA